MSAYEYRVTSAPRRGAKAKGVRTPEARFALALEAEMNRMAAEGWEYVRSDSLPSEERQGWFGGKAVVSRAVLVFRRGLPGEPDAQPVVASAYLRPSRPAPVRAAEPASRPPTVEDPTVEDPPVFAPEVPPVGVPAARTLPPFLSPPPVVAPQVAAPAAPLAAPPLAAPPVRVAAPALGPAATILASPGRAQVPPPSRPGEAPASLGPPIKPFGKASG